MKRFAISLFCILLFVGISNSQTKSLTGTVISQSSGASGNYNVIEVQVGSKTYSVYLFRKDLPEPRTIGTVDQVGRKVRVYYTKIVDGNELRATKVVEVKKSR